MYTIKAVLWSYENGQLVSDEQFLFSPEMQDSLPVVSAKAAFELNEAGNVEFSLVYGHPLYDALIPKETYIRILDGETEIFYGRILTKSDPTFTGQIDYTAEGAMNFLKDSEVTPFEKKGKGKVVPRNLTAEAFFRWCIDEHNACVNDARRQFTVGIVNADKRNTQKEYEISSYSEVKSTLDSEIINEYGGYFRIRSNGSGGHLIDWIQQYDTLNPQAIELGVNVMEMTTALTADDVFTVLRPVGKDGIMLTPPTIDLFPADKMAKMGRIVKSMSFDKAKTVEQLQTEANDYIARIQSKLLGEVSIRLIDMHYLDGSSPKIVLGDRFNNIHGSVGTEYTVAHIDLDFLSIENEAFTFKNRDELESSRNSGVSSAGLSSSYGMMAQSMGKIYKLYNEIDRHASIVADDILLQAEQISVITDDLTTLARNHQETVGQVNYILGTETIQNSDQIASVAGNFYITDNYFADLPYVDSVEYDWQPGDKVRSKDGTMGYVCLKACNPIYEPSTEPPNPEYWAPLTGRKKVTLKNGAAFEIDDLNGSRFIVGKTLNKIDKDTGELIIKTNEYGEYIELFRGSALWTQRDAITGVCGQFEVVTDPGTGKKTIVIESGGGMVIEEGQQRFGMFHAGNLTGGILVNSINSTKYDQWWQNTQYNEGDRINGWWKDAEGHDRQCTLVCLVTHVSEASWNDTEKQKWRQYTSVKIAGDRVDITADQVKVGDTSNVEAWMGMTEDDLTEYRGLIAGKASIGELNAMSARIDEIVADYIRTDTLITEISKANTVTVKHLYATDGAIIEGRDIMGAVNTISLTDNHDGSYTLKYVNFLGTETTVGTFNRAAPVIQVSGSWSGRTYTVKDQNDNTLDTTTIFLNTNGTGDTFAAIVTHTDTDPTHTLVSVTGQLQEDTDHKKVSLIVNALEKASVSTTATYNSGYSSGAASVTVSAAGWNNGSNVVSASNGQSVTVNLPAISLTGGTSFSSHKTTVYANGGGSSGPVAQLQVDATSEYNSGYSGGRNSVTVSAAGWSGGSNVVSASNGKSVTVNLPAISLTGGTSFSNHKTTVYASGGGSSGSVASKVVDATSEYNGGWTGCYGTVGLDSTAQKTLDYGETVTIYAQAKASSGASSKTNVASRKLIAPADRYSDGQTNGWNTAVGKVSLPVSGTKATMSVVTPGSDWNTSGSTTYTVSADNNYAYIKQGSTTVARASNGAYNNGKNAVTLSAAGWSGGSNVVSASNGKSVTVNLPTISLTGGTSFSNHKTTVYASGGGSSGSVASKVVDATSEYNAGWNACLDACVAHTSARWGMTSTSSTLYYHNGSSFLTWSSNGGYKGGSSGTLYEIPARK